MDAERSGLNLGRSGRRRVRDRYAIGAILILWLTFGSQIYGADFAGGRSLTVLTNVGQLKSAADVGSNAFTVDFEANVLLVDTARNQAVVADSSGASKVGIDLQRHPVREGERVRVSGPIYFSKGQPTFKAPAVIAAPVAFIRKEVTNSVFLPAGLHPIEVQYIQGISGRTLLFYAAEPGRSRTVVSAADMLFHQTTNAAGQTELAPGLAYEYFEGLWLDVPSFENLIPSKIGVSTNLNATVGLWEKDFAMRFRGFIDLKETGVYTLGLRSDDAAQVFIDVPDSVKIEPVGSADLLDTLALRIEQRLVPEQEWQWAEAEGTVTFVGQEGQYVQVELSEGHSAIQIQVTGSTASNLVPLMNCRVRVKGVAVPLLNYSDEVVFGGMISRGLRDWRLVQIPANRSFETPRAGNTATAQTGSDDLERVVNVEGDVVEQVRDGFLMKSRETNFVVEANPADFSPGTHVRAVGILERRNGTLRISRGLVQEMSEKSAGETVVNLPVLTTAVEVHSLNAEEAARRYPVRLKGVVTSPTPFRIQDSTRGAYITRASLPFSPGMGEIYEVEGNTSAGSFAPTVQPRNISFRGRGVLPKPLRPTYEQLMSLTDCVQWAELEGVVQAVILNSSMAQTNNRRGDLLLAVKGGNIVISVGGNSTAEWVNSLEDARIRVRGTIAARFNDQRQVLGAYLSVPSPAYICVLKPGNPDPFSLPKQALTNLMQFNPDGGMLNRVKLHGQITLVRDKTYYLMEGRHGMMFRPAKPIDVREGDLVDVAGYQDASVITPVLREAVVRVTGNRPLPVPPLSTIDDIMTGQFNSARVRIQARLMGTWTNGNERVFDLQAGLRSFEARQEINGAEFSPIAKGAIVELTGICSGRVTTGARGWQMDSFDVILASGQDIRMLEPPPRWTLREALMLIAALTVFVLMAALWITLLRGRVEKRTRELRLEIERHKLTEQHLKTEIEERKRIEQQAEEAHKELVHASRLAGMAEVATGVLHNVGNVLNTVNVSAEIVRQRVRQSRLDGLHKLVDLIERRGAGNFQRFVAEDPAGRMIPDYLRKLNEYYREEQQAQQEDLNSLTQSVEHIKQIVAMQQTYARAAAFYEELSPTDVIEDALRLQAASLSRHNVDLNRDFDSVPNFTVQKHKILQILVNLLSNAKFACDDRNDRDPKRITVRVRQRENRISIAVEDNGVGIAPENLVKIFNQGFTTRKNGHGFGLHSCAVAAKEMGGTLTVRSDGPGCGATFTLEVPIQPPDKDMQSEYFATGGFSELSA